jgi:hypothetical protein
VGEFATESPARDNHGTVETRGYEQNRRVRSGLLDVTDARFSCPGAPQRHRVRHTTGSQGHRHYHSVHVQKPACVHDPSGEKSRWIVGNPARAKPDSLILGKDLYKRDGAYYPLNIASRSIYSGGNDVATTIAGTWFSPRTEFTGFLGGATKWPLTDAGKAAIARFDPNATTQKDCIPVGVPTLMFYPVANTITVQRDRVVMKVDWMESERTMFLDGRRHPPASETFLHGHSVGRWEGDTLVAETTNFKEHPIGLSTSLPGSTRKRVTERFRLGPDGKSLIYSGVIEDPVYLARPVEWSGQWLYRPNMPHSNEKCDLEVARKFLGDFK